MGKKRQPKAASEVPASILHKYVPISAKTDNQRVAFAANGQGKHLLLTGFPGTGKTLLAFDFAIRLLRSGQHKKIIVARSVVPTRDMGFLPGSIKDKASVFEAPYADICGTIFPDTVGSYEQLKREKLLEFFTTSFVRGITLSDVILIVDEVQNLSKHEIFSLLTRVGDNCRVILCGDSNQNDLTREHSGLAKLAETVDLINTFQSIQFTVDDVVRSGFTKDFIIAWHNGTNNECHSNKNSSSGNQTSNRQPKLHGSNLSSILIPTVDSTP